MTEPIKYANGEQADTKSWKPSGIIVPSAIKAETQNAIHKVCTTANQ